MGLPQEKSLAFLDCRDCSKTYLRRGKSEPGPACQGGEESQLVGKQAHGLGGQPTYEV